MKLSCIIIEDEPLAMERTRSYAQRIPYLQLIECFDNALDALSFLKTNQPDILFLDIRMDELSGIQLLESVKITGEVILTTAYNEYALKGYDLNVTDYLLKPFTFDRFLQAVDKAQSRIELQRKEPDTGSYRDKFIFVKTEYRLEKLFLHEILYIEGMRDYRRIHTAGKRIMTLQTFREFEQQIPPQLICRVHKSWMVSISRIESVERDRIRIGELYIPVSESYKAAFYELIGR
jgi:DNA-binding LytR/AlgR family response regulator